MRLLTEEVGLESGPFPPHPFLKSVRSPKAASVKILRGRAAAKGRVSCLTSGWEPHDLDFSLSRPPMCLHARSRRETYRESGLVLWRISEVPPVISDVGL
jgi:hypothetical protein